MIRTLTAPIIYLCLYFWGSACQANPANFIPTAPKILASSYVLMDAATGTLLVEKDPHTIIPPASLTKIMTAYIAANEIKQGKLSLDDKVEISIKAWKMGGSKMYVREGTRVPARKLLKGIVVQSGNDASIALAEHLAGDEAAFAELMNLHAESLNMENTHFVNATGWPDKKHFTTAYDLALLTTALIENYPEHYELYKEKEYTYNSIRQTNRNLLLWRDETVDGVKTGYTKDAGYCLVASAEREGMRLVAVIMGAKSTKSRAREAQKLLNYGFRFYQTKTISEASKILETPKIWQGEKNIFAAGLGQSITATLPKKGNLKPKFEVVLNTPIIKAPLIKGTEIGKVTVTYADKVITTQPLLALENVKPAGFLKRWWHWLVLKVKSFF